VGTERQASEDDDPIGLEEVAVRLGVHYMTAYRYVRTGLVPARQDGGRWWVERADLDEFVAGRSRRRAPAGRRRSPAEVSPELARRVADRLEQGDDEGAWQTLEERRLGAEHPTALAIRMLADAMQVIGDRWEAGETSIGEEHRASVVAMRLLGRLGVGGRRRGRTRGSVVLAAAPGDHHGLPTAMAAEVLRGAGFTVVDLGADLPPDEVWRAAIAADRLLCVGLCATTRLGAVAQDELARAIAAVHAKAGSPVVVGGAAVPPLQGEDPLGADRRTTSVRDLLDTVEAFSREAPARRSP
jgi:excisionase family DNA binding protein